MSFCPSRDVHSIYIDNEMPQKYVAEYEAHIKDCPNCQRELEVLKNIHDVLKADSESSSPEKIFGSENYMDESYRRLMIKMAYNKNTKISTHKINSNVKKGLLESVRYAIPTAVAAAILAVVLPVRNLGTKVQMPIVEEPVVTVAQQPVFQYGPVANIPAAASISLNKDRGVVISGNIHESVLPIGNTSKNFASNVSKSRSKKADKNQALINDYEVFRPAFSEEKTISIRITVPGMDTNPVTTEIELPYDVFTGYFE